MRRRRRDTDESQSGINPKVHARVDGQRSRKGLAAPEETIQIVISKFSKRIV
jgi:hypothetical protein